MYRFLSLWEIAHRWHDEDPNLTDPRRLPLPVQDKLRLLTRVLDYHQMRCCNERGVENHNVEDLVAFDDFMWHEKEDGTEPSRDEIFEQYMQYRDIYTKHHNQATEGFENCYANRIYDKGKLDSVYITDYALITWCEANRITPPQFWFKDYDPRGDKIESKPSRLKPNQLDKQVCQAVARTLWHIQPQLTIADIIAHQAIQRFANGAQYVEKTLRGWISEVDERPEEQKRGRPTKKSKSTN